MSLLIDLLLDLIGSGVGPSTDRAIVVSFSAASIILAAVSTWLVMTFPDPIKEPAWGLAVLACAVLCGAGGLLVSSLHLRRNEADRLFGGLALTVNAAAIATPLFWIVAR